MSARALARATLRFSIIFAIAAVVLAVLGPFVLSNFGVGDLGVMPLLAAWETAPSAVIVSLIFVILLALCLMLAAMLAVASLVIRSAMAHEMTSSASGVVSR